MSTTIGDPFTLSSHPISQKSKHSSFPLRASCSKTSKSGYRLALGADGDGVSIIDLTTLQPEASAILGSSCNFAGSPVSRTTLDENKNPINIVYASFKTTPSGQNRTLSSWCWKDTVSSLEKRSSITLENDIFDIYAPSNLLDNVIVLSQDGTVSIIDAELRSSTIYPMQSQGSEVLFSFLHTATKCRYISRGHIRTTPENTTILSYLLSENGVFHFGASVIEGENVKHLSAVKLEDAIMDVIHAALDEGGNLTVLTKTGDIYSYSLTIDQDEIVAASVNKLSLQGLHFQGTSVLSLGSTHIIITGITTLPNPEIVLLLWDVRYSVLLAEKRHNIPSALSTHLPDQITCSTLNAGDTQAILILSPRFPTSRRSKNDTLGLKSFIFVIPYHVPETSSLSNALGKSNQSKEWIKSTTPDVLQSPDKDGREIMLQKVSKLIQDGRVDLADQTFFEWTAEVSKKLKEQAEEEARKKLALVEQEKPVNGVNHGSQEESGDEEKVVPQKKLYIKGSTQVQFSHIFVAKLLRTVLRSSKVDVPYSSKIPAYLLERKLVSDNMVEGGVLKALREKSDWASVKLALKYVPDIAENQLILLLRETIRQQPSAAGLDAMDVDQAATTGLSLHELASLTVSYSTSAPALRLALRENLPNPDDVLRVLEVLDGWITTWNRKGSRLRLDEVKEGALRRRYAQIEREQGREGGLPNLELILSFLSSILDASLVNLLQFPSSHTVLKNIYENIDPQVQFLDDVEKLRGSLEPFTLAHQRNARQGAILTKKQQRKKDNLTESYALAVDLYQVEEFFL